jgi:hypothetical protein
MMNRRVCCAICCVGLIAFVVAGCGEGKAPQPRQKSPAVVAEEAAPNPRPSIPDVKSSQLPKVEAAEEPAALAVTLDEIAADTSKFDRKRVEFTAKVARPGHNSFVVGGLAVILTGDGTTAAILGDLPYVTAVFPPEDKNAVELRTLPPQQEVTVSGELRVATENVWEIHGAKLVKTGADSTIAITATELTQAFVDDQEAGAKQFGGQPLRLKGKVAGKPFEFGAYAAVMITGSPNAEGVTTAVVAQFRPEHFYVPGNPPLNQAKLTTMLPYEDGSEVELYGTLQGRTFGSGRDGQPALALDAYPATWPVK